MSHVCIAAVLTVVMTVPTTAPAPEVAAAPAPEVAAAPAPEVATAPAPEVATAPAPVPVTASPPAPVVAPVSVEPAPMVGPEPLGPRAAREQEIQRDPELLRQDRRATGLVLTGSIGLGLGLGTLLLVSAPAHGLYRAALEDAEQTRWVTSQDEPLARARYRRQVSLVSAGVGAGLATVGGALLAVGLSRRARLRNPGATLSLAPVVGGGHWGVGASMRF